MNAIEVSEHTGFTIDEVETTKRLMTAVMRRYSASYSQAARLIVNVELDKRTKLYSFRALIFNTDNPGGFDAEADTDPDLPPNKIGGTTARGLPQLAEHCADLFQAFFPRVDRDDILACFTSRLPTLRTTLSRNPGQPIWWNVPIEGKWVMRVNVVHTDQLPERAALDAFSPRYARVTSP
jgi:hypothetical protein